MTGCSIKKIRKVFDKTTAVDDIEFDFHPGEVHGFIGPNGAGKTTTMRILATLDTPSSGDAFIMGYSIVENPREVRRRIGFVPDWFSGFENTTVHEYLDFFARAYELSGMERIVTVGEIEEFIGLVPLREKLVLELSRGMQQRVCLGRSLVNNPDVLLMDEPAANLDPRARIELRELVKALAAKDKAILISSHILSELSEMCNAVTIIDKGKILVSGKIEDIKTKLKPHKTISIRALCPQEELVKKLYETPKIKRLVELKKEVRFDFEGSDREVSETLAYLVERGIPVIEWHIIGENLEDIFMNITGNGGENGGKN